MPADPYSPTAASDLKWLLKWYFGFVTRVLLRRPFTPPSLNLLVTSRCDLRCRHCFLWESLDEPQASGEITLEEMDAMARSMGPLFSLVLSGGEPFLRTDLAEVARIFHTHTGVKLITILTNGQMPQRIQTVVEEMLIESPELLVAVGVSLDGVGERHDAIRQKAGAFDKAVRTVQVLKDLAAGQQRLSVQACSVLMAMNEDHIFDLYAYLRDQLRPHRLALNLIRQDPRDPQAKAVRPDTYGRLVDLMRADTFSGRLRNRFPFDRFALLTAADLAMMEMISRTVVRRAPQIRCRAGSASAVVFPDGTVRPCELKPGWGNLRETGFDFSGFWNARRTAARARGELPGRECFCTHEIDCFLPSIPFDVRIFPLLGRLWRRVARGQRQLKI